MVPCRIPAQNFERKKEGADEKVEEVSLDHFYLSHYSMLLNIFPFDTKSDEMLMTPERDYINYLPLERMKPF